VDAAKSEGPFKPIYRYFGYDEPNYTYMPNGRKLVGELAALSSEPVHIRTHFLLATGDGKPDFKWGSTNAYTEDAAGKPVYDWTIADRIFDTYRAAGAKPFVEIGFMPQALSTKPDPYRPVWSPGAAFDRYYVGWAYPPKDFAKWGELVYQWTRHAAERYGRAEVESWYWEVWNEPDIAYWRGTPDEYNRLYDTAVRAVKRAAPNARVGGPATTGPASGKAAAYLRQFLEYCDRTGAPLDFISFHAKGRPTVVDGHVRMGLAKNAEDVDTGYRIVASFPKFRNLPIVLSESDPEGCAACSARVYPQNAYRNGPLYASYTAAMLKHILDSAVRERVNIEGMLTWAFEFEGQPWFDGLRTLATNGIDKPILNLFRMTGLMRGDRVPAASDGAPGIDALATRSRDEVAVLVWNYFQDDVPGPDAPVKLDVAGLPNATRALVRHYRIDGTHSNAYALWKQLGSPQSPTPEQYAALEGAGQLQLLESPHWIDTPGGKASLAFPLPRQGVSLVVLSPR
jgi:xylan 1,4-beta-xylosidase